MVLILRPISLLPFRRKPLYTPALFLPPQAGFCPSPLCWVGLKVNLTQSRITREQSLYEGLSRSVGLWVFGVPMALTDVGKPNPLWVMSFPGLGFWTG